MAVDYQFPITDNTMLTAQIDPTTYTTLGTMLLNTKLPMSQRFRALFTLKAFNSEPAVHVMSQALVHNSSSPLLKHEIAYVLGQMRLSCALPILISVLNNTQEHPMVRHEAAEAMGAIGDISCLSILQSHLNDPNDSVRETCDLAIHLLKHDDDDDDNNNNNTIYSTIDPAPSFNQHDYNNDITLLRSMLLDTSLPLFKRYRAMFTLRNIGTENAVLALADGFLDNSALFRHEIAYVFGQLQHPASVPSLCKVLENPNEISMVRHEAAEALGSIATPDCLPILQKYANDDNDVVRESCQVGLDMWDYENSNDLQYADGLNKVSTTITSTS